MQYWLRISACLPIVTTLWNSASRCFCPGLSVQTRFVAIEKLDTDLPEGRAFISGRRVRFPQINILLRFIYLC